jgi:hypothetical protein
LFRRYEYSSQKADSSKSGKGKKPRLGQVMSAAVIRRPAMDFEIPHASAARLRVSRVDRLSQQRKKPVHIVQL